MNRTLVRILVFLSVAASLSARDLTLEQAMQMARDHSFAIKKAQAAALGAGSDLSAARAERLPTLGLAGVASYTNKTAQMNINIPGLISLQREVGSKEKYQADFRLNMPLFTGGRITGGIDAATASADYYQALESATTDQIVYVAHLEYLNLSRADQVLAASESARRRTGVIQQNIASLFEAGSADSIALLDARLAVSKADQAVDQARTNRRGSEIRMLTLIGLDPSENLTVTDTLPEPQLDPAKGSLSTQKAELRAAEAAVRLSQSRIRLAGVEFWPTISAYGGYSYGKPNLDQFNASWNDYWTVGANLNWSFNIGGRAANKSRAARYNFAAAQNDRDLTRENLERDISLSYEQMKLAYTKYQNSLNQFQIANDSYRLAKQQHQNGDLATNRLLEIEADLSSSESNLAAAKADFFAAQTAYRFALGSDTITKGK
ncbi:MAG: TolC family protein [Candidatus Zixiibacteriota bacterium]